MTLRISGKNLDMGAALRARAEEAVVATLVKYHDGGYDGHLTLERDGTGYRTECTLHLPTGRTFCVSAAAHDPHQSVTQTVERIGKQLRRYKREKKGRLHGHPETAMAVEEDKETSPSALLESPIVAGTPIEAGTPIVAETVAALPSLALEQATLRFDRESCDSFAFRNRGTGRVNILRRRDDGGIGWIDIPEAGGSV